MIFAANIFLHQFHFKHGVMNWASVICFMLVWLDRACVGEIGGTTGKELHSQTRDAISMFRLGLQK